MIKAVRAHKSSNMRIAFVDITSSRPYSEQNVTDPEAKAGGFQATVVRVAEQLGKDHDVWILQRARDFPHQSLHVTYDGLSALDAIDPAVLILTRVREGAILRRFRSRWPEARMLLWLHNTLPETTVSPIRHPLLWRKEGGTLTCFCRAAIETRTEIVCVSTSHRRNVRRYLGRYRAARQLADAIVMHVIYNPVDIPSFTTSGNVDRDKLLYPSSNIAGRRDQVIEVFKQVRKYIPTLRLYVTTPGYDQPMALPGDEGVINLGSLSHEEVIEHMRSSLCTFAPQDRVPEAFGLVFAESNAVGTPVVACPIGAAEEFLPSEQLVDAANTQEIVSRLLQWRDIGRPKTERRDEFRIERVTDQWQTLLRGA